MSLINQMLRDLENRNHDNNPQQPLDIKVAEVQPRVDKSNWLFLIAVPLALSSAFLIFQHFTTPKLPEKKLSIKQAPETVSISQSTKPKPLPLSASTITQVDNTQQPKKMSVLNLSTGQIQKLEVIEQKERPVKRLSASERAEKLFQKAQQSNRASVTQSHLQQALRHDPMHLEARVLLVKTLMQQGLTTQTADFLGQSLQLFPDNLLFINTRAQIFLQQQSPAAAIKTLHLLNPVSVNDLTYLSLLASAYQQQGDFYQSVDIYRRLISNNPSVAEYWLGLAISLENTGKKQQAIQAYSQAMGKNTLKPEIVSYIKQRMTAL